MASNLRPGINVQQRRKTSRPAPSATNLTAVLVGQNRRVNKDLATLATEWTASATITDIAFPEYLQGYVDPDSIVVTINTEYGPHVLDRQYYTLSNVGVDAGVIGSPTLTTIKGGIAHLTLASGIRGTYTSTSGGFDAGQFKDNDADFVLRRVAAGDFILRKSVPTWLVTSIVSDTLLTVMPTGRGPEQTFEASMITVGPKDSAAQSRVVTAIGPAFKAAGGWGPDGTVAMVGDEFHVDSWATRVASGGLEYGPAGEDLSAIGITLAEDERLVSYPAIVSDPAYDDYGTGSSGGGVIFLSDANGTMVPALYFSDDITTNERTVKVKSFPHAGLDPELFPTYGVAHITYGYAYRINGTKGKFTRTVSGTRVFTSTGISITNTGNSSVDAVVGDHIAIKNEEGVYEPAFEIVEITDASNVIVTDLNPAFLASGTWASNVDFVVFDALSDSFSGGMSTVTTEYGNAYGVDWGTPPPPSIYGKTAYDLTDRLLIGTTGATAYVSIKQNAADSARANAEGEIVVASDGINTVSYMFHVTGNAASVLTGYYPVEIGADFSELLTNLRDAMVTPYTGATGTFPALAFSASSPVSGSDPTRQLQLNFGSPGMIGNAAFIVVDGTYLAPLSGISNTLYLSGGAGITFKDAGIVAGDLVFNDRGILVYEVVAAPTDAGHAHKLLVKKSEFGSVPLEPDDTQTTFGFTVRISGQRSTFSVRRVINDYQLEVVDLPTSPNTLPAGTTVDGCLWIASHDGVDYAVSLAAANGGASTNMAYKIEKKLEGSTFTGPLSLSYTETLKTLPSWVEINGENYDDILGEAIPENPLALAAQVFFSNSSATTLAVQVQGESYTDWINALTKIQIERVFSVVPLTQDPQVLAAFRAHVESESSDENKRERCLWQSHRFIQEAVKAEDGDTIEGTLTRPTTGVTTATIATDLIAEGVQIGDSLIATGFNGTEELAIDCRILGISVVGSTTTLTLLPPSTVTAGTTDLALIKWEVRDRPQTRDEIRDEVAAYAASIGLRRVRNIYPDQCKIQYSRTQDDGSVATETATVGNFYSCVMEAAKKTVYGPAKSLTKRSGGGIYEILDPFFGNEEDQDVILGGGNYYLTQLTGPGGAISAIRALTTDGTDIYTLEESVVSQIDSFVRRIRRQLSPLLGPEVLDSVFLDAVSTALQSVVRDVLDKKEMKEIKLVSLTVDQESPDLFRVSYEVTPYISGSRGSFIITF